MIIKAKNRKVISQWWDEVKQKKIVSMFYEFNVYLLDWSE